MLEIYYTSAPSGLKRGSSGFCTVAATDNVPKPLLERLESLSAYRHHFSQGDGQANPVSYAHWKLAAQGKEYHVLSRVCDSGVDHTHRTNAFAHHLALEKTELAAAGPAALLQTPGVMIREWDNTVGSLSRSAVPPATHTPPGPCASWAALAGDAGYAGLLLETAIKSPTKPVCILFSPGQDMMPLIAEVLRLVPTPLRWAITFNTYFTSMPSSATCSWRCCIDKTPAADAALRAAANGGLVINLADPSKLPPLPKNAFVETARDGMPLATQARSKGPAKMPGTNVKVPPKNGPAPVDEGDDLAAQIALAVQKYGTTPPPPLNQPGSQSYDSSPLEIDQTPAPVPAAPPVRKRFASAPPTDFNDELARRIEAKAASAEQKRQRQMLIMYGVAVAALAIASGLLFLAWRSATAKYDDTPQPRTQPATQPVAVITTRPTIDTRPAPIATAPAPTTEVATAPTQPTPATQVVVVPPPKAPRMIVLRPALDSPIAGSAIKDKTQSFTLTGEDAEDIKNVRELSLRFPNGFTELKYETDSISGTFTFIPVLPPRPPYPINLRWKGSVDFGDTDLATITYSRPTKTIEVTWKTNAVLKKSEAASLAYWLLANSTILGIDVATSAISANKMRFQAAENPPVLLTDPATPLKLPADVPADATPAVTSTLPDRWTGEWFTDWETKDPSLRSADNRLSTLRLKCPTTSIAIDAWFTITFKPHFASVETNFAQRLAAEESDLNRAQADLTAVEKDLAKLAQEASQDLENFNRNLSDWVEKAKTPGRYGLTADEAAAQVRQAQTNLENRRAVLETASRPANTKRSDLAVAVAAHTASIAAFRRLDSLEVTLKIPKEIPTLVVRFKQ